jgi:hypothetical protein
MPYTFPTLTALTKKPTVEGYEFGPQADSTIKNDVEGGYKLTRARYTRIPLSWNLSYTPISEANMLILDAFQHTVGIGAQMFDWTNPVDNVTYTVRLADKIRFKMHQKPTLWEAEFVLEEV